MSAADCGGGNEDGNREILGVSVSLGEHEVHWRNFLQSLVSRGLSGVELIISDDHSGLKSARKAVFGGVPSPQSAARHSLAAMSVPSTA